MVYVIITLCVLYVFIVLYTSLTKINVRVNTYSRKKRLDFKLLNKNFIASRLLWGLVIELAIIYSLSIMAPLIWAFYTSFKDAVSYSVNNFNLPQEWHFSNYLEVLEKLEITEGLYTYNILDMFLNSVIYSFVTPLVGVFWTAAVAYIMSRFKFFGNGFLYNLGIIIMMFPIVGSLSSQMIIYKRWGLYDNLYVNIFIPPSTSFSGLTFMMLYGVFKGIDKTYSEAAYLDGANDYTVMFRIIFPMALPTCATLYILGFVGAWNTYETFLVWYPSSPNIAYGMYRFQYSSTSGSSGVSTPQILAGFIMVMIPSLILFLASQKLIKSNFIVGGLKG